MCHIRPVYVSLRSQAQCWGQVPLKIAFSRAGEAMTAVRTLDCSSRVPDFIPGTHMAAHYHVTAVPQDPVSFPALPGHHTHSVHRHMQAKHPYT